MHEPRPAGSQRTLDVARYIGEMVTLSSVHSPDLSWKRRQQDAVQRHKLWFGASGSCLFIAIVGARLGCCPASSRRQRPRLCSPRHPTRSIQYLTCHFRPPSFSFTLEVSILRGRVLHVVAHVTWGLNDVGEPTPEHDFV